MKQRIEEKLEVSRKDYPKAIAWLSNNGFTLLHPTRIVNSVYFDNHKLQMLFDAIEGITPRRKIRIRYYGSDQFTSTQSFALEVKESTALGRLKSTQSVLNFSNTLSKGVYDKIYGLCFPVVKIKYKREYFKLNNWRITLDRDLTYENYGNPFFFKNKASDLAYVLEIKTSIDQDINILRNFFDFPRSKFSKYERAFEHLKS